MVEFFYRNKYYHALKKEDSHTKINYLNPSDEAISAVIGLHEEEDGYLDTNMYKPFIRNKEYWDKIYEAKEWHVTNFIEPFFINWGYMGTLNRFHKGWQKRLLSILQGKTGKKLMEFNNLDLLAIPDKQLQGNKEKIVSCFEELKPSTIGPTATGKLFHLLYPNFFPLWDANIREDTKKAYKKRYDTNMPSDTGSGEFYFKFMNIQRGFIKKYNDTLKTAGKYCSNKSILRMSDIYFWTLSNKKAHFIEY